MISVSIPSSVTSIGSSAFSGCSGLISVTIPSSVTSIGSSAFENCIALDSVIINSNSIASKKYESSSNLSHIFGTQVKYIHFGEAVKSIGESACSGYRSLKSVAIGNNVKTIGSWAFNYCSGLEKAEFGSIKSLCNIKFDFIYSNPLYYAKHLYINGSEVTDLVIPESVTSIGNYVFYWCSGLTSVTIPNSVTSIGDRAFEGCSGLTSIHIGSRVNSITNASFSGCGKLESIVVEKGNEKYDSRDNCNAIIETSTNTLIFGCKNTIIPNSVTAIGTEAFYACYGLTSITISDGVNIIGVRAFLLCI